MDVTEEIKAGMERAAANPGEWVEVIRADTADFNRVSVKLAAESILHPASEYVWRAKDTDGRVLVETMKVV